MTIVNLVTTVVSWDGPTLSDLLGSIKGLLPMYKNAGVDLVDHLYFVLADAYISILRPGVDD